MKPRSRFAAAAFSVCALVLSPVAVFAQSPEDQTVADEFPAAATPAEPRPAFWSERLSGYLPTRDGTRLSYSVILPEGDGPFPVLIDYTAYSSAGIGGEAYRSRVSMINGLHQVLVENGYAVMGLNPRGTGCSYGDVDLFGPEMGRDGADAVEWAARQPWSTGKIGMTSYSYGGTSQLAVAQEQPEHLVAIAPGMAAPDLRGDWAAAGGIPAFNNMPMYYWGFIVEEWRSIRASAIAAGDQECADQVLANIEAGAEPERYWPTQMIRHQYRDAWTEAHSWLERTDRINVPVFSVEAFQDDAVTSRAGHYQERLNPDLLWLVQTNGPHSMYETNSLHEPLLRFYDHFLKGEQNGFAARPRVDVWMDTRVREGSELGAMDSAPQWHVRSAIFPLPVEPLVLPLGANGVLGEGSGEAGPPDSYQFPGYAAQVSAGFNGWVWEEPRAGWEAGSLAYTSDALDSPIFAYGSGSVDLWVSSDIADTDLHVVLTNLLPDGREVYVQQGVLRVSNRALDEERSTILRPVLQDTREAMSALSPGQPVLARVELTKFAHLFRPGSKIRLWIDAPGSPNASNYTAPSTNMIWHDPEHPSRLVLGVTEDYGTPPEVDPCLNLSMPCRPDPHGG